MEDAVVVAAQAVPVSERIILIKEIKVGVYTRKGELYYVSRVKTWVLRRETGTPLWAFFDWTEKIDLSDYEFLMIA